MKDIYDYSIRTPDTQASGKSEKVKLIHDDVKYNLSKHTNSLLHSVIDLEIVMLFLNTKVVAFKEDCSLSECVNLFCVSL